MKYFSLKLGHIKNQALVVACIYFDEQNDCKQQIKSPINYANTVLVKDLVHLNYPYIYKLKTMHIICLDSHN